MSYRAARDTPSRSDARLLDVSVDLDAETIGLSDAYRWIAEQLPSAARPETKVVQHGSTMHVLTLEPFGRQRSRLTVRSIPSRLLERLLEVRALALGQARALSSRELEVLRLLVTGNSLADIAGELGITPRTIKFHQTNIQDKLGADSRFGLFRMVLASAE